MRLFDPQGTKSESEIQAEAFKRARARGWTAEKYENKSVNGSPDSLFDRKDRAVVIAFWIEFKRLGERPNAQQVTRHRDMRARGWRVEWFDNVEDCLCFLTRHEG